MFDRKISSLSIASSFVSFVLLITLPGCGGSLAAAKSGDTLPAVGAVSLTVSANTVDGTNSITVNATVTDDRNSAGVTWKASAGTLSGSTPSSTTFSAPAATSTQQTITITATSAADTTKSGTATITVPAAPMITSLTGAQQAIAVGTAYSATLTGEGGIPPYKNWALASGSAPLPPCLSLSSFGVLASTSTPAAKCAGVYPGIIFTMTDSGTPKSLAAISSAQTITVTGPTISFPASLPVGQVGSAYTASIAATGAIGTVTYSLASGALPPALSLDTNTGAITGAPQASDVGTSTFSVKAVDSLGDVATSGDLSILIYAALALPIPNPASLPSIAYVGVPYNNGSGGTITGTGGSGNLSLAISGSELPANGLSAISSGSVVTVSGTPTSSSTSPYTITFGLTLTDLTTKHSITQTGYSITVNNPTPVSLPAANPSSLGSALIGQRYTGAIEASGGVPPYVWSIGNQQIGSSCHDLRNGSLCATNTGGSILSISGTPDTVDMVTLANVTVVDSAHSTATQTYTITVNATQPITVTLNQVPQGMVDMPFTFNGLNISGGESPYTVTYTNIPAGLSQPSGTWTLTGTPTTAGTTPVTVTVADSALSQNSTSITVNLVIEPKLTETDNSGLKGQYACYYQQSWDGGVLGGDGTSTLYRGGSLFAFTADGNGKITGGEIDSNSPISGYRNASANGLLTGTYAIGGDNRGYALISAANQSNPLLVELAAGRSDSNGIFLDLALLSMDDVGSTPSGSWGSGVCYQQITTDLSGYTPSGSYASVLRGEDGSGNLTATVDFLQFVGEVTSGVYDTVDNGVLTANQPSPANTYASTDSYGRMELTTTVNPHFSQVWYLTRNSSGTAVRMSATPHNSASDAGFSIGEGREQIPSALSTGNPINGKVAMYLSGLNSSRSFYKASVMQADAYGSSGNTTLVANAHLSNEGGYIIAKGSDVGETMTYTTDATTGRTTLTLRGQTLIGDVLYVYGPNSAAVLYGDGSPAQALVGWLEPQIAPTSGTWSINDLSASFFMYKVNNGDPKLSPNHSFFTVDGSGSLPTYLEDVGGEQWADWANGLCGCSDYSAALVPDTSANSSTGSLGLDPNSTIGMFDIQLTQIGITKTVASCLAVSVTTATDPNARGRLLCLDRLTDHPSVNIAQQ